MRNLSDLATSLNCDEIYGVKPPGPPPGDELASMLWVAKHGLPSNGNDCLRSDIHVLARELMRLRLENAQLQKDLKRVIASERAIASIG